MSNLTLVFSSAINPLTHSVKQYLVKITVFPLLDYGDVAYCYATNTFLHKLDVICYVAIHLATGASTCSTATCVLCWTGLHSSLTTNSLVTVHLQNSNWENPFIHIVTSEFPQCVLQPTISYFYQPLHTQSLHFLWSLLFSFFRWLESSATDTEVELIHPTLLSKIPNNHYYKTTALVFSLTF